MSRSKKNEGMSADELKRKMYSSLQSAGVLNDLRGYLRQSVINELRGRYEKTGERPDDSGAELFIGSMKRNENPTWEQKSMDNLVYQHLKQSRYLYTLSIFQQESGIDGYNESLTEDLLHRLGASPDLLKQKKDKENETSFQAPNSSSTPVANGNETKLLMWKILSRISSPLHSMMKRDERNVRETKEKGKQMSLAEKLQAVDDEMDGTIRQRRYDDIEQRKSVVSLANATRKAEEEAEKRARDSFEQWKKVELATMRVQEQEKAREKILETTRKLEDDFSQRREALISREKNAIERLNNQKDSMEKDLHHQRQTLLRELDHIQQREKGLQERERVMKEMEMVKLREIDLIKAEALSEQLRTAGVKGDNKIAADSIVSSCAESLRRSLTGKESRQLDEVLRELENRAGESEMLRSELESLKKEMKTTKSHLQRNEPAPSSRHDEHRGLDDRSLRQRLDMITSRLDEWSSQSKAQNEVASREEMERWRREMTKLFEVKDQFEEKQQQLDDMMERVTSRIGGSVRTPRKAPASGQLPATSLRLLLDPQYDVTKYSSIRDYEPVQTERNVRWADKMPYSISSNLIGENARSPRNLGNASSMKIDLDSSNETSSSADLSTSGIRRDIREKFRNLEKETEQLDQMYKRYITTNYKDAGPKQPEHQTTILSHHYDVTMPKLSSNDTAGFRPQPKPRPYTAKPISLAKPFSEEVQVQQVIDSSNQDSLDEKSVNHEVLPRQQDKVPPLDLQSSEISPPLKTDVAMDTSKTSELKANLNQEDTIHAPPSGNLDADLRRMDSSSGSSESPRQSPIDSPVPQQEKILSPLPRQQRTLPPIQTKRGKTPKLTVSDLLIGTHSPGKSHEDSRSSVSSDDDSTGRRYTGATISPPKSPFERPALLERKREELLPSCSTEHEKSLDHEISFGEEDGFQEILHSIDVRSARSIEGDMDPKLTDLLSKLEPVPSPANNSQPNISNVTSPTKSIDHEQGIVMSHDQNNQLNLSQKLEDLDSESSVSDKIDARNDVKSPESMKENEYSDEFASSASEVKTMSEFEPSSTSIPRIEEKVIGQDLDDDRSGADINWSNFQPDKSGELLKNEQPTRLVQEEAIIDFEKSQSESLEAPSSGDKKEESDEDFW